MSNAFGIKISQVRVQSTAATKRSFQKSFNVSQGLPPMSVCILFNKLLSIRNLSEELLSNVGLKQIVFTPQNFCHLEFAKNAK